MSSFNEKPSWIPGHLLGAQDFRCDMISLSCYGGWGLLIPAGQPACRNPDVRSLPDTRAWERLFSATWVTLKPRILETRMDI